MDWSTIIVAVLALVGTLIGSYASGSKTQAVMLYRVDELAKKVDKHNTVIERTYKVEQDVALLKEEIKDLKKGA